MAVDDCMSLILWTRYFLEVQGYGVDDVIIYQDNKNAILLEQKGHASSTRQTRHLNIRYFLSQTESRRMKYTYNIVQHKTCWRTISPSHYKGQHFANFAMLS